MMNAARSILSYYDSPANEAEIIPFGSGLINYTWKVRDRDDQYILQRVNDLVFKTPTDIAHNIEKVASYLHHHHPGYLFVSPLKTSKGASLVHHPSAGYFRMFPFVQGSQTIDVVESASQAYEAALAFGKFTSLLAGFNPTELRITLPSFHDLGLRYTQFLSALEHGNPDRISEAAVSIEYIKAHKDIVDEFEKIKKDSAFRIRVTHHDTKISNILFDSNGKSLCVIDTDTMMPGYFISDVGDMMRTYLSPVSEEEKDLDKIMIRDDIYTAIVQGYCKEMNSHLTLTEKQHFVYAGKFMIYMQAIRFLTDHLNNDVYYGARYAGHNFMRCRNQLTLLQKLIEKEEAFREVSCEPRAMS